MTRLIQALVAVCLLLAAGSGQSLRVWDTTEARGTARQIDFNTSEGTWMSVDISPDGRWIVFDLLANIYRIPADGGNAELLTRASGISVNCQPRFSPDGKEIVFISDRLGQNNLWIMSADGTNPAPLFVNRSIRVMEPTWTPDGRHIIVRQQNINEHGIFQVDGLWMYPRDGGTGSLIFQFERGGGGWPAVSPDGRFVYFHLCTKAGPIDSFGCDDFLRGGSQLRKLDLSTKDVYNVTQGQTDEQFPGSSGGAIAPEISPDGNFLAFARRIPDGTVSYKSHKFGPRTALWIRDMRTGTERIAMDPIETDMAERQHDILAVFFELRILPGYGWAKDSKSIVISQGGKIRRLWIDTGRVDTIPLSVHVQRTISEAAHHRFHLSDGPLDPKFLRWYRSSPDRKKILFQAVGKIWLKDLETGQTRRLTPDTFEPFEFSPCWSRDGKWVAFTSWSDQDRGQLWKLASNGGVPISLTQAGEYLNPVWSPDGSFIVVAKGAGVTGHGRSWASNGWYDLVRISADGGVATAITMVQPPVHGGQIVEASFGSDGRLYYPEQITTGESVVTRLLSVNPDGTDRRIHLTFPYADEVAPSPDGRWVAFQEGYNVYLAPFSTANSPNTPFVDKKKDREGMHIAQLTLEGGLYPHWIDANTLEFGSGNRYFVRDVLAGKTSQIDLTLSVPRSLPKGRIALVDARIITPHNGQVIQNGTVVVNGGRIECVGSCSAVGVDRSIDLKGRTIIPGLIDMHAHHHREYDGITPAHGFENAAYLAYGVTTTLDPAAWSPDVFSSAELIEAGKAIGPRTFSTGDPFFSGDGPYRNEVTSYEVAEHDASRLQSWGAVTLKQYLEPLREQRQWIIDIARKKGLRVTGEGNDHEYNLGMIMDGQTGFEHPVSYAPFYSDVAKFYGQAGMFYSPTFVVGGPGPWNKEFFLQDTELWKDAKQRSFQPWTELAPVGRRHMVRPITDYSYPLIAQGLADIITSGGNGSIGGHGEQHGIGSHWELWMAASGLGPMGALRVATMGGAQFLGADSDLGSIESGKIADLVVLNSNPLENIRNTADIAYVMKAGILYNAPTLDEVWPENKPFGAHSWVNNEAFRSDDRSVDYWDKH